MKALPDAGGAADPQCRRNRSQKKPAVEIHGGLLCTEMANYFAAVKIREPVLVVSSEALTSVLAKH